MSEHTGQQNLWDKTWKDRSGRVVLFQIPNWPLVGWALLTVISLLFNGTVADVFSWLADLCLAGWALLEIFKGVNYFRRGLGILVLVFSITSIIKLL